MTTVAGSAESAKANLGFAAASGGPTRDRARERLMDACRNLFGDEFVNRVDEFVPFAPLDVEGLRQVATFAVDQLRQRLAPTITLRCADAVLDHLARHNAHARAVRAAIKNELEPLVCAGLSRAGRRTIAIQLKNGRYTID
jgi:ATP-dependent Clp protease ATP-binding subunit ClpA